MARAGQHGRTETVLGGGALIVTGLAFAGGAWRYGLGTLTDMQPGFFPFFLGLGLALTGLVEALAAWRIRPLSGQVAPTMNARAVVFILAGLLMFGVLIGVAGLMPAIFISTLLAMMADRPLRWRRMLIYAAAVSALAWAVFILGLGMPIPLFWW